VLDNGAQARKALEAACEPHGGQCPDAVFLCAGQSFPGYWVEQDEAAIRKGIDATYFVSAFTALVGVAWATFNPATPFDLYNRQHRK